MKPVVVFDLDDTLFDEIDFVQSGFYEVARYLDKSKSDEIYSKMMHLFNVQGSGRIFDQIIKGYGFEQRVQKLVEIYRFHKPDIVLSPCARQILQTCRTYPTALISDGHYIMQQNKFRQLGLEDQIGYPLFTDFYQTHKPETKPFEMVMDRFGRNNAFVYIADNPQKDFFAPNQLGWRTVRYKNPRGIYRALISNAEQEVVSLCDIKSMIRQDNEQ